MRFLNSCINHKSYSYTCTTFLGFQKLHRDIVRVIRIGHMAQFQNIVTLSVTKVQDKFGRTLLYMTVLHERRHMFRHLLKMCPEAACVLDKVCQ